MDKNRKWKRTIDLKDFFIMENGDEVRVVDIKGTVIQVFKKNECSVKDSK
jgi:membrane protein implicated in regulation of membrane protease activity